VALIELAQYSDNAERILKMATELSIGLAFEDILEMDQYDFQ
jgi:hypothetical protein